MIIHLADRDFLKLMENPVLHLPKRWNGRDFETALATLLDDYLHEIICCCEDNDDDDRYCSIEENYSEILNICNGLKRCIHEYHNGFPARAFLILQQIMESLIQTPLKVYQKSGNLAPLEEDWLRLYRIRSVNNGTKYKRADIFHVPVSMRSTISTCRYSIAGYPSLYLSTSIELALEETNAAPEQSIVSRFKLARLQPEINIQVLELGIKPQDFNMEGIQYENNNRLNDHSINLSSPQVKGTYLKWYPLIAACSFIRANKNVPFSSEYVIPQLLMQWIRTKCKRNSLMGLRYFSCASVRASDMGFDYVFPVSNWNYAGNYCSVLRDAFWLTEPVYIRDYHALNQCKSHLEHDLKLDKI